MSVIETDYLIVGAGAAGMAIADSLLTHSTATMTIVDRRAGPGGHWIDAYPFVRLHQPSAFYGVDSTPFVEASIDTSGPNAGFHPLAGAEDIRTYFDRIMQTRLLPSGRVRYLPEHEHRSASDDRHEIRAVRDRSSVEILVRNKLIDTTYLEGGIPATHPPPFELAEGVRCVTPSELSTFSSFPERVVIVGGGKTAMDVAVWLQSRGVDPAALIWIKPREAWLLNRRFHQPYDLLPDSYAAVGRQIQLMAEAASANELFAALEADRLVLRVDPLETPTLLHGALVSESELDCLRRIRHVVRLGHVRRVEKGRIILDEGEVSTSVDSLFVHCAATGLAHPPLRPIFEGRRITVQPIYYGYACFQFAEIGVVEATLENEQEKNRLCVPISYWDQPIDYLRAYLATMQHERRRFEFPSLTSWARTTRLNPFGGLDTYRSHPKVIETRELIKRHAAGAAVNLARLTC